MQSHPLALALPSHIFPSFHHRHARTHSPSLIFLNHHKCTANLSFSASALPRPELGGEYEGPIELPSSSPSIFATTDDPAPIQVASSVLLTGAISVFLFLSIRRRAKRVKELKFRSSGATRTLKADALDSLKAFQSSSIDAKKSPTPVQAFLGGIAAAVIALILYKFTTTIEAALNRQTLSDNFSVRQITITIRTIVNGLCYLATFVFGVNSVGLFLYSAQLAINSFMEDATSEETKSKDNEQSDITDSISESTSEDTELTSNQGDGNPDNKQ